MTTQATRTSVVYPAGLRADNWRGRLWCCRIAAAVLVVASGCATQTHQQRREQAQNHWNEVRAKIKRQLATQQFESGELDGAITTVREALGLDPMAAESYLLLSRALLEKNRMGEAGRILTAAHEMKLESAELTYTRGVVAERSGDLASALRFYRQARRQDPSQMDCVVAEAECLVAARRPEEARELVRDSIERFDRDGTLDALEAEISLVLRDDRAAAAAFRRAVSMVPDDPMVAQEFGLLLVRMGRFAEAVGVLQPLEDAAREEGVELPGAVVRGLARSYLALGHVEAQGDLLSGWLQEHPNDVAAWLLQARSAMTRKDDALAGRCAAAVRRLAPDSPQTSLLCGYLRWRQGDRAGALNLLERSLVMEPDDVLLHCLIGQVLAESNHRERARQHWRRALQIDPHTAWARNALAELDRPAAG